MKIGDLLSENEKKMFKDLGSSDLFELSSISVSQLYDASVKECFLLQKQGNAVEALRKAYKVFVNFDEPKRFTPEFEKLISYE